MGCLFVLNDHVSNKNFFCSSKAGFMLARSICIKTTKSKQNAWKISPWRPWAGHAKITQICFKQKLSLTIEHGLPVGSRREKSVGRRTCLLQLKLLSARSPLQTLSSETAHFSFYPFNLGSFLATWRFSRILFQEQKSREVFSDKFSREMFWETCLGTFSWTIFLETFPGH